MYKNDKALLSTVRKDFKINAIWQLIPFEQPDLHVLIFQLFVFSLHRHINIWEQENSQLSIFQKPCQLRLIAVAKES